MFEKVNKSHPDKIADRIAGAIVDIAYSKQENPKVAVEVLVGHNTCRIINETSCHINKKDIEKLVNRIIYNPYLKKQLKVKIDYIEVPQDAELAKNQSKELRCGDNGIFKGCCITNEQSLLTKKVRDIYKKYPTDGKYLVDNNKLIMCHSWIKKCAGVSKLIGHYKYIKINPLGYWTGGINVDTGATNRKLGSDMGDAITGGGLHGKDLSKADVSVNIVCHILAQNYKAIVSTSCAIGDTKLAFNIIQHSTVELSFSEVVKMAHNYIKSIGGFEALAEWGLIR